MKKLNLTEKLILYFLATGVLTITLISWYAYYSGKKAIISRTFDQLTSVRVVKQNQVENYFAERITELDIIMKTSGITECCRRILPEYKETTQAELYSEIKKDQFLTEYFHKNPIIKNIIVNAPDNTIILGKTDTSIFLKDTIPFFNESINPPSNLVIKELILSPDEHYDLVFCKSIIIDAITYRISIRTDFSTVNQIMVENDPKTGWGKSGESYIVGNDHLMKTPSRFIHPSVQKTQVYTEAVTDGLKTGKGSAISKDYRNIDVLSSYDKLHVAGINWVILAEIDFDEAMAPVLSLRNEILFLSIFITFLVFILALVFARSISKPIRKLTVAAEKIRDGDYSVSIDQPTKDEIGVLSKAINDMAFQIRQQARARIDGQDAERQRLSMELHDGLGQWLLAARFRLESTDCSKPEVTRQHLTETKKMVDETIEEIRRISNNLLPGALKEFGLESAVKTMVREINKNKGMVVHLDIQSPLDQLITEHQLYIFRIIQEALNNAIKHAEALETIIVIKIDNNNLHLKITDNGKGFDPAQRDSFKGNGLFNMKERTTILGGKMILTGSPGKGTCLSFTIPT